MIELEIKKLELQNGLVPFDEWFDSLRDKGSQSRDIRRAQQLWQQFTKYAFKKLPG